MSAFEDFIQVELPRRPWVADDPAQETVPVRRGAGPRQLEFVEMTDGQVLGKVAGVVQGVDITGLGSKAYVHQQSVNSDSWVINHNLDSEDYVVFVADVDDSEVFPNDVLLLDENTIIIDFNTPMRGKAVFVFAS